MVAHVVASSTTVPKDSGSNLNRELGILYPASCLDECPDRSSKEVHLYLFCGSFKKTQLRLSLSKQKEFRLSTLLNISRCLTQSLKKINSIQTPLAQIVLGVIGGRSRGGV